MFSTIIGLFDRFDRAEAAIEQLIGNGFIRDDISVVTNGGQHPRAKAAIRPGTVLDDPMANSATITSALLGLYEAKLPGFGSALIAGPIASALFDGDRSRRLDQALRLTGIPEGDVPALLETVREGAIIAIVTADGDRVRKAAEVFRRHGVARSFEEPTTDVSRSHASMTRTSTAPRNSVPTRLRP